MKHTKAYLFAVLALVCLLLAGCTEDVLPLLPEQPETEDYPVIIYDMPEEAEDEPGFIIYDPEEIAPEEVIPAEQTDEEDVPAVIIQSDEEAPEENFEPEDAPEEEVLPVEVTEPEIILPAEIVEEEPDVKPETVEEPEEHSNSPPAPTIDIGGSYTSKEDVALYLHLYRKLPKNFITKKEAEKQGWIGGGLKDGKCIGGSYFGNYDGKLPKGKGIEYHECDIDTMNKKKRGVKRLVWSNKGAIYYTDDHYETFTLLYEEWAK